MSSSKETAESVHWPERLRQIRGEIDAVDGKLLELLNRRAALSLEVGRIKSDDPGIVFKPLREREVLDGLEARNPGPLPEEHLVNIWREIFSSSRALQRPQRVAYLGPEGTFSYFAGAEYLGHAVDFRPCGDLHEVFRCVHDRECELGVVPLENSLQGTVGQSFDLFLKYAVFIQAELFCRVSHCLLTEARTLTEVTTVYSPPQPLAQCGAWLRTNLPGAKLIPVESTAAAARRAAGQPGAAAIGNRKLSGMLPLRILAAGIEDEPGNWTRFVIIGPVPARAPQSVQALRNPVPGHAGADKTSVLFTTPDKPGALSSVLRLLAGSGINMRKLESRPMKGECWKSVFFADVECDLEDPVYAETVEALRQVCNTFRILGAYPTGPQLDRVTTPSREE